MMSPSELDGQANRVVDYLQRENAVRVDEDTVGNYLTVYQICEALNIYVGNWIKVKNTLLKRGINICYVPGKGHFIGGKGEAITNYVYKYKIAKGWVKHLHTVKEIIETSDPAAKAWINRRFKDFTLEEELENAQRSR